MPAEHALGEFAAPGADQSIESDDLAATDRERYVGEARSAQVPHIEQHLSERDRLLVVHFLDGPSHHVADELALVRLGNDTGRYELAVPKDRHPVGQLEDLLQAMADIDDRHALRMQAADEREELIRLAARQISGRLVEDQET